MSNDNLVASLHEELEMKSTDSIDAMQHFEYQTEGTCARIITFEVEDNKIHNVHFIGGCPGNLKMISKLIEGMNVNDVYKKCLGNTCGNKGTSCADQLALACKKYMEQFKK
ncbi:MAG: TIGR03905 family TSCPD domain-containing protein [Succinivibrionaceae bacterium]